jgi:predicted small lipoprotein YifL
MRGMDMEKYISVLFCFLMLLFITACSKTEPLELVKADVNITNDESLLGAIIVPEGEKKGQKIVPTALYYKFIIKNTSNQAILSYDPEKEFKIYIEPSKELLAVVKDTIGSNIYDVDTNRLGVGHSIPEIPAKGENEINLNYTLGAEKESSELPPLPSMEKLEKLRQNALKGTLVIIQGEKEVARLKLNLSK